MQIIEKSHPILKKIVRRHRGEWSLFGMRDWLSGA